MKPPSVKCNHVAARSMEVFRRLGVSAAVRDAGLPPDFPNDIAFRTTFVGPEFARIPIPCRRDRYSATEGPDTWWPTPEPPHRINQIFLEPVLVAHALGMPGITFHHRTKVLGFTQSANGVLTEAENLDTGERLLIDSDYMVGCDGGHSQIRRQIGATADRRCGGAAHPVDLFSRAVAAGDDAGAAGVVQPVDESSPQCEHLCHRRPGDLAHPLLPPSRRAGF